MHSSLLAPKSTQRLKSEAQIPAKSTPFSSVTTAWDLILNAPGSFSRFSSGFTPMSSKGQESVWQTFAALLNGTAAKSGPKGPPEKVRLSISLCRNEEWELGFHPNLHHISCAIDSAPNILY